MTMSNCVTCAADDCGPSLAQLREQYLVWMQMQNWTPRTIEQRRFVLGRFLDWAAARGVSEVGQFTPQLLAAYRRWLFHYRNAKTARPLTFATQASYLSAVGRWCAWLAQEKFLDEDVSLQLELPQAEQRLPADVLTAEQVERLLNAADVTRPLGLRDRALLETFYSTAIRCSELLMLQVYDVESSRGIVKIRKGKGRKDRVVPIGQRALAWLEKYTQDVRPGLAARTSETTLFVTCSGRRFGRTNLSALVRGYFRQAGIAQRGSCHLLRHTAATLMLENGAEVRALQQYLGHERLNTTQIYTHVSIKHLQDVHRRTHPARPDGQPHADGERD